MELDEFIEKTIDQVMRGVARSAVNLHSAKIGGSISPQDFSSGKAEFNKLDIRTIEFDVAVTVEKSHGSEKSGKAGIKVIEGGLSSKSDERVVGESRVRFAVPVIFPGTSLYAGSVDVDELNKKLAERRGPL
ncbi:MAG TPA: hypothetical protein PKD48_08810 [Sphingopyxis sp.]|nr:hypothetical protein [Sphingopyxis sp.]HMQ17868.1 hypothetical protein [Sphingopyxis sp.]